MIKFNPIDCPDKLRIDTSLKNKNNEILASTLTDISEKTDEFD